MQWSQGNGFGGGAADRDSPLIGDRPDFVESAVTVGLGVLQMEIGYTFIYDNDGSQSVEMAAGEELSASPFDEDDDDGDGGDDDDGTYAESPIYTFLWIPHERRLKNRSQSSAARSRATKA